MSSNTIVLENVGPIARQEIKINPVGFTVLYAPNGSGKSLALEAVQAGLRGSGKVPLRDQAKRGKVEVAGAKITIGGTCRHTGECRVEHLEGKFDIGALIDPRLKNEASADAARIKALVHLTGAAASPALFQEHEAFTDWDQIVDPKSLETDDLVEMARRIKSDYDAAARIAEATADREEGHADGLAIPEDLDLTRPHDSAQLAAEYDRARDVLNDVATRQAQYETAKRKAAEAHEKLKSLFDSSAPQAEELQDELAILKAEQDAVDREIEDLNAKLKVAVEKFASLENRIEVIASKIEAAQSKQQTIEVTSQVIKDFEALSPVSAADVLAAETAVTVAKSAMEHGAVIRQALANADKATHHRKLASEAREKAARLRDAGRATDDVLSSVIKTDLLRVESDGKSARLVTETSRGKSTPYHELSAGERGAIAIDIAADKVGAHGILVISQEVFEGLDRENRLLLQAKAVERKVAILTAEASQDESGGFEVRGVE